MVRFDFLGWGRSDKPQGCPCTSANQVGDLAAVIGAVHAEAVGAITRRVYVGLEPDDLATTHRVLVEVTERARRLRDQS